MKGIKNLEALKRIKDWKGLFYRKLVEKEEEEKLLPKFFVKKPTVLVEFPKVVDIKKANIIYPLIEPFAYANIKWDPKIKELIYNLIEPKLSRKEAKILEKISEGLIELVEVELSAIREPRKIIEYLEENVKKIIREFGLRITRDQYVKMMYYIYRNFIGYNEIEPLLQDPNIEDISCDGIATPVYVVHRKFGSLKTNISYKDLESLREFVVKLAERCGRYVSFAEPILAGTLPDGSRVSATIARDVVTRGPVFCVKEGFIQFNDGSLKQISTFFEESKKNSKLEMLEDAEVLKLSNDEYLVGVYPTLKQNRAKILTVMKLPPPQKLVDVVLEDGKKITVTPNHLFHITSESGLKLIKAGKMTNKMYLPVPVKVNVKGKVQKINLLNILRDYPEHICIIISEKIRKTIEEFIKKYRTKKGIDRKLLSREFGVGETYFYDILKGKTSFISAKVFLEIGKKLGKNINIDEIEVIWKTEKGYGKGKKVKIPNEINEKLAYVIGLLISDGSLTKNYFSIRLYGEKKQLISKVRRWLKELFGKSEMYGNELYVCNKFLSYYLNKIFEIPIGNKTKIVKVPEIISRSNNKVVAAFLRGLFDGDGSSVKSLNYKTFSKNLAYALPFLLSRLGIYSLIREEEGYRIIIPSPYEKVFLKKVGFLINRKQKILEKRVKKRKKEIFRECGRVPNFIPKLLKENNIKVSSLLKEMKISSSRLYGPTISKILLSRILSLVERKINGNIKKKKNFKYIKWLTTNENEFVKIKEVILRDNLEKAPVYDVELNPTKFFIGGLNGPLNLFDTIRKFGERPFSPVDQIEFGTASVEVLAYLWYLVEHGASMLITGGTATGKTSLLNSICMFVPPEAKIVSIEDTREIKIPHVHWVPGLARVGFGIPLPSGEKYGGVTLFDLLKESFRQNPDYVVVGETRGPEAYVMFQGMASGHTCLSTFHAGSLDTLVKRLITPPIELSPTLIESLDVVILMIHAREKGKSARRIKEIVEIEAVDPKTEEVKTKVIFLWNPSTDTFEKIEDSVKVKKIVAATGGSIEDALAEIRKRERLLRWLKKNKIRDYLEVTKYINMHYKEPEKLLKMIEEGQVSAEVETKKKPRRFSSIFEMLGFKVIKEK